MFEGWVAAGAAIAAAGVTAWMAVETHRAVSAAQAEAEVSSQALEAAQAQATTSAEALAAARLDRELAYRPALRLHCSIDPPELEAAQLDTVVQTFALVNSGNGPALRCLVVLYLTDVEESFVSTRVNVPAGSTVALSTRQVPSSEVHDPWEVGRIECYDMLNFRYRYQVMVRGGGLDTVSPPQIERSEGAPRSAP